MDNSLKNVMNSLAQFREEIVQLCDKFPNDTELGKEVRKIINEITYQNSDK